MQKIHPRVFENEPEAKKLKRFPFAGSTITIMEEERVMIESPKSETEIDTNIPPPPLTITLPTYDPNIQPISQLSLSILADAAAVAMEEDCVIIEDPSTILSSRFTRTLPSSGPSVELIANVSNLNLDKKRFHEFLLKPDSLFTLMREFHTIEDQKAFFHLVTQRTLNLNVKSLRKYLKLNFLDQVNESEFVETILPMKRDSSISKELNHFIVDLVYERDEKCEESAIKELFQRWKAGNVEHWGELKKLMWKKQNFEKEILEIQESIQHGEIKKYLEILKKYVQMISGDAVNIFEKFLNFENFH
jgi:hypothetical protein